ncbi:M48 family metallopeptidase [Candidatus Saccharibacteria bacterium]|nr:M48 family metallopeptidase [Candidatus Saccharibacteria bacterium]
MAQRQVYIEGIGEITLAKRRGTHSLRLSINAAGRVRIGLPYWASYAAGISFAKSRADWINEQQVLNQHAQLRDGMKIGKAHTLYFNHDPHFSYIKTRIDKIGIYITGPYGDQDERVQLKARMISEKALYNEARVILPQRVKSLSALHNYSYKELKIRKLTSRWGSCSSHKVITLSYFLMQLPWELIDYVILHELVHTKYLNHSPRFWQVLEELMPNAKPLQKVIKTHKPRIQPI